MAVYTTNQYGRLVNVGSNEDDKVSATRNTTSSSPIGSSSNTRRFGDIETQVKNSPAYQSAFQILSNESDKSWLQRLEMIPYSVSDASSTIFDDIGASNNFNDKQDANYQYCMEQISALMAEYQSWKNSLPIKQAQQFAIAGVNSAITGQGLSSSEIPNVGVSSDPGALQSTNVGEFVNNLVQRFLDVSSGSLDWIAKFNEIELNNKRFKFDSNSAFADFVSELSKDGVVLPSDIHTFEDLLKSDYTEWYDTASARAKKIYNEFTEIRNMDAYGSTVAGRVFRGEYRSADLYEYDYNNKRYIRYGSPIGASINMDEYTSNIADLQYQIWLKDLEYRAEYAKQKKEWHDENGYTNAEDIQLFDSDIKASEKLIKKYEKDKAKIYVDYIKRLKSEADKGNLSSRIQLMDALYELNNTSTYADLIDDLYELLKDWAN